MLTDDARLALMIARRFGRPLCELQRSRVTLTLRRLRCYATIVRNDADDHEVLKLKMGGHSANKWLPGRLDAFIPK